MTACLLVCPCTHCCDNGNHMLFSRFCPKLLTKLNSLLLNHGNFAYRTANTVNNKTITEVLYKILASQTLKKKTKPKIRALFQPSFVNINKEQHSGFVLTNIVMPKGDQLCPFLYLLDLRAAHQIIHRPLSTGFSQNAKEPSHHFNRNRTHLFLT